jgi:hypothetical protein
MYIKKRTTCTFLLLRLVRLGVTLDALTMCTSPNPPLMRELPQHECGDQDSRDDKDRVIHGNVTVAAGNRSIVVVPVFRHPVTAD